jgi:hypothetical protein
MLAYWLASMSMMGTQINPAIQPKKQINSNP